MKYIVKKEGLSTMPGDNDLEIKVGVSSSDKNATEIAKLKKQLADLENQTKTSSSRGSESLDKFGERAERRFFGIREGIRSLFALVGGISLYGSAFMGVEKYLQEQDKLLKSLTDRLDELHRKAVETSNALATMGVHAPGKDIISAASKAVEGTNISPSDFAGALGMEEYNKKIHIRPSDVAKIAEGIGKSPEDTVKLLADKSPKEQMMIAQAFLMKADEFPDMKDVGFMPAEGSGKSPAYEMAYRRLQTIKSNSKIDPILNFFGKKTPGIEQQIAKTKEEYYSGAYGPVTNEDQVDSARAKVIHKISEEEYQTNQEKIKKDMEEKGLSIPSPQAKGIKGTPFQVVAQGLRTAEQEGTLTRDDEKIVNLLMEIVKNTAKTHEEVNKGFGVLKTNSLEKQQSTIRQNQFPRIPIRKGH